MPFHSALLLPLRVRERPDRLHLRTLPLGTEVVRFEVDRGS